MAFSDSRRYETRNLNALLRVSKALATEIRLDDLLQVIVDKAAEVMDADRATLFLYDESRNELWSKTTQRLEKKKFAFRSGTDRRKRGQDPTVINIPDTSAHARFDPDFDKETESYRTRLSSVCP